MTATHDGKTQRAANMNHRIVNHFKAQWTGLAIKGDEIKEPVTLRIYQTPTTPYAVLWVNAYPILNASGSGKAEGYGYHKASTATEQAIKNAGFTLDETIDDGGDNAIDEAVKAVTKIVADGHPVHVTRAYA